MNISITGSSAGLSLMGEVVMRLDSGLADDPVMEVLWRDVEGYEGRYQISSVGQIKSIARVVPGPNGREVQVRERILKHCYHYKGYPVVYLSKENEQEKCFVHRLVAKAFIPNPDAKPIVNHKDLDKQHCEVSNLEWVTEKENTNHYWDNKEPF